MEVTVYFSSKVLFLGCVWLYETSLACENRLEIVSWICSYNTFFFFFFKKSHSAWSLQLLQPNMLYFFLKQLGKQYRGLNFVPCSEITSNTNVVKFILVSYKLADPANITNLLPAPISDGISLIVNSYQAIIKTFCHYLRWYSLQCYSLKSLVVKAFIRVVHKTFSRVLWAP